MKSLLVVAVLVFSSPIRALPFQPETIERPFLSHYRLILGGPDLGGHEIPYRFLFSIANLQRSSSFHLCVEENEPGHCVSALRTIGNALENSIFDQLDSRFTEETIDEGISLTNYVRDWNDPDRSLVMDIFGTFRSIRRESVASFIRSTILEDKNHSISRCASVATDLGSRGIGRATRCYIDAYRRFFEEIPGNRAAQVFRRETQRGLDYVWQIMTHTEMSSGRRLTMFEVEDLRREIGAYILSAPPPIHYAE